MVSVLSSDYSFVEFLDSSVVDYAILVEYTSIIHKLRHIFWRFLFIHHLFTSHNTNKKTEKQNKKERSRPACYLLTIFLEVNIDRWYGNLMEFF